mgnify:FL=1
MRDTLRSKELVILLLVAFVFIVSAMFITWGLTFRLDTDYEAHLPVYDFLVTSVRSGHGIPMRNPYIGTGIPVFGDPQLFIFNPLLFLPLLLFGVEAGMRITLFLSMIASGITMWFFLSSLGIWGYLRLWAAALYMFSGGFFAIVASGHVEHLFSYALLPLFYLFALRSTKSMKESIILGVILGLFFLSGDMYRILYLTMLFFVLQVWDGIQNRNVWRVSIYAITVYMVFFIVSVPKLLPFFLNVLPIFERYYPVRPFAGSIHLLFSPFPYIMPFQTGFYDRPFFRRLFGFEFNWHEYYAFISPLPFLFLLKFRSIYKDTQGKKLLLLIGVGFLYASLGYPYSPFYWLVKNVSFFQSFRAPQRMYVTLLPVVIAILSLGARALLQKESKDFIHKGVVVVCGLSIAWVYIVGLITFRRSFEEKRVAEKTVARHLRTVDKENYFVVTIACCMQRALVSQKIPILNYYYGWRPRNAPTFLDKKEQFSYDVFFSVRPRYIIAKDKEKDLSLYSYVPVYRYGNFVIWKTDAETIVPTL